MTTKKVQKRGESRKVKVRLSDPTTVRRVFELQRDEPFTSGDFLCVGDLVNDLLAYAGGGTDSREVFAFAFPLAARRVERNSGAASAAARRAYKELRDVLARLDAGETLTEIEKAERARYEAEQETRRAADLAEPEPKDKTSGPWRIWKLRQIEHAFGEARGDDPAAYNEAWRYCQDLIRGLTADGNFWHTGHMRALLPQLICIRQELDTAERRLRRMRAGMKGAETRKAKAAKKGGK